MPDEKPLYSPGDRVLVVHNPHRPVEGVLGTVVAFRPGVGFMGCDLVDVRYEDPRTGEEDTFPFGTANLAPASRDVLLARAERLEMMAREMRSLARQAPRGRRRRS